MDEDVTCLLRQWGLEAYIGKFEENNITTMAMALLGPEDIKELFSSIGHRVLFTKNLEEYKKIMYPEADNNSIFASQLSDITIDASSSTQDFPFNELLTFTESSGSKKFLKEVNEKASLKELLENSLEGKALLSVPQNKPLDNNSRQRLVRIIGTYILSTHPGRNITAEVYSHWTNEIVQLFTEEKRAVYLHTKLVESGRGIANRLVGKLPDQIHNLKRKYRESGIISKRPRNNSPNSTPSTSPCASPSSLINRFHGSFTDIETEIECEEALLWLTTSSHPWETVEQKWSETTRTRLKQLNDMKIDDYFTEYPALQKPTGYILLQNDFKVIYPEKSNGLFDNFPSYKNILFETAEKRSGKDRFIQNLLSLKKCSEDISNLGAFLLIPSLIATTTLKLKGTDKKAWRPSKSEVRQSFISHICSEASIAEAIEFRQNKLNALNLRMQPFILAVGESLSNTRSYFIIINQVRYRVDTVIEAVDACIKIIFTLNAKYPDESSSVWTFIQNGFYKIKTKYDKVSTATNTLLSELGLTG